MGYLEQQHRERQEAEWEARLREQAFRNQEERARQKAQPAPEPAAEGAKPKRNRSGRPGKFSKPGSEAARKPATGLPGLKAARTARGMTQVDLAAAVGCRAQFIWRLEKGRRDGSRLMVRELARLLECSEADLRGASAA